MQQTYRPLTTSEIEQLKRQGCSSENWNTVHVAQRFNAMSISNTHLAGKVKLGAFEKEIPFYGGLKRPSGISNASLFNCTIGNNVFIHNVNNYIANYTIEDDVVIENIDLLAVDQKSSFGNGTKVAVLIESGERSIPIYDFLSAHIAYIIVLYRHREKVITELIKMIQEYTESVSSAAGIVSMGARVINCRILKNVKIGPYSCLEGVNRIEEVSINSCMEAPVHIGSGVIVTESIINSGSNVTDGTIIAKCFVGQGCLLGKQYSAENSVFFANCGGFHGEAWSIFAGPYTVTHHKSTLLISGLYSFLNAGSGSNQSNHMYKLGPLHQGVVERGSKTTSDSYMLWPAKVGPFTLVMGRHYRNSDTSDLPFSYLIESEDESILIPGVNLRSVGTIRDARKWPRRDNRKDPCKIDFINFNLLSPYTIQKMIKGYELLKRLKETSGETSEYYFYHGVKIKKKSLLSGMEYYRMGINKFIGNALIKRLEKQCYSSEMQMQEKLKPDRQTGMGKWIDLAGMLAPEEEIEKILQNIENGTIKNLRHAREAIEEVHGNYYQYGWTWCVDIIQKRYGKKISQITALDILDLLEEWKEAVIGLNRLLLEDAKKEFTINAQIGFGLDGDLEIQQKDFEAVRGKFHDNTFVKDIEEHTEKKSNLYNEIVKKIKKLC